MRSYGTQAPTTSVIGDLNDTPASTPLEPLISGTDLKDAFTHSAFDDGVIRERWRLHG